MIYKNKRFTLERTIESIREFMDVLTPLDRSRILLHMVANTGNFKEISPLMVLAKELDTPFVNVGDYIRADVEHMSKTLGTSRRNTTPRLRVPNFQPRSEFASTPARYGNLHGAV